MYDFFISYSRKDKDKINNLLKVADRDEANYFLDTGEIPFGDKYGEIIDEALQNTKAVICIWTENSDESKNVKREIYLADEYDVPIIPIKIGGFKPKGLNYVMSNLNQCRIDKLTEDISGKIINELKFYRANKQKNNSNKKINSDDSPKKSIQTVNQLGAIAGAAGMLVGGPLGMIGALAVGATGIIRNFILKDSVVKSSNALIDSIKEKINIT